MNLKSAAWTVSAVCTACSAFAAFEQKNPVTDESVTFTYVYKGATADASNADDWQDASGGHPANPPNAAGKGPYAPFAVDGDDLGADFPKVEGYKQVNLAPLEGWNLCVGAFKGVSLDLGSPTKLQNEGTSYIMVDASSKAKINYTSGNPGGTIGLYVAGALTFENYTRPKTADYYFKGAGKVVFQNAPSDGTHNIYRADFTLASEQDAPHKSVTKKYLVTGAGSRTFATSNATVTGLRADGTALESVTKKGVLYGDEAYGCYAFGQDEKGVYIAYIDRSATPSPVIGKIATSFITEGAPKEAYGATVATTPTAFGLDARYAQEGVGQVVVVTNATAQYGRVHGGTGYNAGSLSANIWMEVTGGSFDSIFGGSDSDRWEDGSAGSITGNIVLEVGGDTEVHHVLGGNYKDGRTPTITGDIKVVVRDNAVVKGLLAGAGISAHNNTATYAGNTSVLVKNVQSDNSGGRMPDGNSADSSDYIVGGGVYGTNANSKENVTGSTSVTVDLASDKTGTFVKHIVGGGLIAAGGAHRNRPECKVGGSASVSITAPKAVTFSGSIFAGGYLEAGNGDVTVAGTATATLNGGTYTGAKISGGVATGERTLNISGDTAIGASTVVGGFSAINVTGGSLRLDAPDTSDAVTITVAEGAAMSVPARTEETHYTLDGSGTVKIVLSAAGGQALGLKVADGQSLTLKCVNGAGEDMPGHTAKVVDGKVVVVQEVKPGETVTAEFDAEPTAAQLALFTAVPANDEAATAGQGSVIKIVSVRKGDKWTVAVAIDEAKMPDGKQIDDTLYAFGAEGLDALAGATEATPVTLAAGKVTPGLYYSIRYASDVRFTEGVGETERVLATADKPVALSVPKTDAAAQFYKVAASLTAQ